MRATAERMDMDDSGRPEGDGLEAVFREHGAAMIRAAYRVAGSLEDAEDALQTVCTRLLARDDGGREVARLGTEAGPYLRRAAVNAALDLMRFRKRQRAVGLEEAPETPDAAPDPERLSAGRETRERVRAALARLQPKAAQVFALRYFEGLANRDIARSLAMSQTAVAVSLHRTRSRLRKELRAPLGGLS